MPPATLTLVIFGIEEAIQQTPALIADLQNIFANGAPTAADFAALRAKVASESYQQFVPQSGLPPATSP
jgi:hypothetical protein